MLYFVTLLCCNQNILILKDNSKLYCISSKNIKICHLALFFQIVQPVSATENVNEIPCDTNQVLAERQGDELIQNYCDDTDESRNHLCYKHQEILFCINTQKIAFKCYQFLSDFRQTKWQFIANLL